MYLSALFVLDFTGKVLICRGYRGNVNLNSIDNFILLLNEEGEDASVPIIQTKQNSYAFIKMNNVYVVGEMTKNANVTLVLVFMWRFIHLMTDYFTEIEEESIKDNFVIIHELLDEIMDFGYPQVTDTQVLKKYITQNSYKLNKKPIIVPSVVTNIVSWRPEGIKYRNNEVFVDVIESINLLINLDEIVVSNEVVGCVKMKVNLSGMPQLRLGLSDKFVFSVNNSYDDDSSIIFDDVKFHHCVQLSRIYNEKNIYFIPPDGEFNLMSYRLNVDTKPLILIKTKIMKPSQCRIEYTVKTHSQFKRSCTANNVEIKIPVPHDVYSPIINVSLGQANYLPGENAILWKIKYFSGSTEQLLKAQFKLPSIKGEGDEKKIPIQVKFVIPHFTISGLQIRFIKVIEKSNYKALTWVRYATQNGDYFIRIT